MAQVDDVTAGERSAFPELTDQQIGTICEQIAARAEQQDVPSDKIDRVRAAVVEVLAGEDGSRATEPPA